MAASDIAKRFRLALELFELGESMLRQRLRRDDPAATDVEVDQKIRAWLRRRPGAEFGDAPGTPRRGPVPTP